jgi:hypothetical protein
MPDTCQCTLHTVFRMLLSTIKQSQKAHWLDFCCELVQACIMGTVLPADWSVAERWGCACIAVQVLVRIHSSSVNPVDTAVRKGALPIKFPKVRLCFANGDSRTCLMHRFHAPSTLLLMTWPAWHHSSCGSCLVKHASRPSTTDDWSQ